MAHNPYHAPSYEVSLDEEKLGPGLNERTRKAAVGFVETVRAIGCFLIVGGLCTLGLPITATIESFRVSQPRELEVLTGLWCVPALLVGWGILQLRRNILAVTFTGVAALAAILHFSSLVLTLIRSDAGLGVVIEASIAALVLVFFLLAPIVVAIDVWVWWYRGLDAGEIAREYEHAQLQKLLSQCVHGSQHVE
jgi:hypothetical protein